MGTRPRTARRAGWLALSTLLLAGATVAASAPDGGFAITSHVIAGGGTGHARSVCFELAGTVGQPAAGSASGGGYDVVSGFWAARVERPDSLFQDNFEECHP